MPPSLNSSRFGFFPASGTDYRSGSEPEISRRLNRLGRSLRLHLVGISGARTPAHSVEVGGFADDPHTRGQASDTPGIESVPETTLRRFGLTRPFPGASEADHIQLLGGARGTASRPARPTPGESLADAWTGAGGSQRLAPIMVAIAMAESGGQVDAQSPQNTDGSYDYGAWQINSVHSQYDPHKLTSDLDYNARAAVAVQKSEGLGAWTTYSSGAYKSFMSGWNSAQPSFGRTRPGGNSPGQSEDGSGVQNIFAEWTGEQTDMQNVSLGDWLNWLVKPPRFNDPMLPHHVKIDPFGAVSGGITGATDFLKFTAWIFHPRNILRAVEFITGVTLMFIGFQSMLASWRDESESGLISSGPKAAKRATGEVVSMTPPGRAVRASKAARVGKREARDKVKSQERTAAQRKGRVKESKRLGAKSDTRASRPSKRPRRGAHKRQEEIPF